VGILCRYPSVLPPRKAVPLVLIFHGSGGTGNAIERMTGFSRVAKRDGLVLVYPEGTEWNWNGGRRIDTSSALLLLASLM
jgi:poly(3-hydroxybutyrate) depolymerase